jgi:hypothetical protein
MRGVRSRRGSMCTVKGKGGMGIGRGTMMIARRAITGMGDTAGGGGLGRMGGMLRVRRTRAVPLCDEWGISMAMSDEGVNSTQTKSFFTLGRNYAQLLPTRFYPLRSFAYTRVTTLNVLHLLMVLNPDPYPHRIQKEVLGHNKTRTQGQKKIPHPFSSLE